MRQHTKMLLVFAVAVVVAGALAAGLLLSGAAGPRGRAIRIGGKNFTEQEILGEILAQLIEANTDISVDRRLNLGGTMISFNALKAGDLDLYPEYTGTGLVNILQRPAVSDPEEAYRIVADAFDEKYDLVWLEPFAFNNTYTLTMRADHAEELGIETFSDLAAYCKAHPGKLTAGFDSEFLVREDGYKGLAAAYDFRFADEPKHMDPGLMYKACSTGAVDVICAFATDGRIAAYGLKVLTDDKRFFPPYHAAPLVRAETLRAHPQLREVLGRLAGMIDDQTMRELNYQVDRDENPRTAAEVADEFLRNSGLK